MDEYIKRSEFIEAVKDIPMWGSAAAMLADSIPTADVAPVVRCKDCAHLYGTLCTVCGLLPQPDDFCSYGKRKDGGDG